MSMENFYNQVNRFLKQVYNNLPQHDDVSLELNQTNIKVTFGDGNEFEIRAPGGICFTEKTVRDNMFETLHDEVDATVKGVKEYLYLMENSPDLKARDFNMPYKKLIEFNGVVLGGVEHSDGRFEFTTWDIYNNALSHGHYYGNYQKAKEDFAERSGLVTKQLVFNREELIEIYRCAADTLSNGYELTNVQKERIQKIQTEIKDSIIDFDRLLEEEISKQSEEIEQINEQTM